MGTFAYAPAIKVLVESEDGDFIDISGDLIQWQCTRRSNAVSSFNFQLQNTQRKYDAVFWPGCRITVQMKRLAWCQVFTGTLNNAPMFSAWPRALTMSASCSLKKLQFWYWNPNTQAAFQMMQGWWSGADSGSVNKVYSAEGDGGLSGLIKKALVEVVDWDARKIHIGKVPNDWFEWARKTETSITNANTLKALIGSVATVGGQQVIGTFDIKARDFGGIHLSGDQVRNASSIFAAMLDVSGLSSVADQDLAGTLLIMAALQESSLMPLKLGEGDRDSVGFFQMRPSQGWGTATQLADIPYQVTSWLNGVNGNPGLYSINNWRTIKPLGYLANKIEVSAVADSEYQKWEDAASALVAAFRAQMNDKLKTQSTSAQNPMNSNPPTGANNGKFTGAMLASTAVKLIKDHPAIPYQQMRDAGSDPKNPNPSYLDCSSFVQWCYYNTTGELLGGNTYEQWPNCLEIDLDTALHTQGALLFGEFDSSGPGHVGISLGDGVNHAAEHTYGQYANISPVAGSNFSKGGLPKGIDYSSSATTQDAAKKITAAFHNGIKATVSTTQIDDSLAPQAQIQGASGQEGTNPFSSIFNITNVQPGDLTGDIFSGDKEFVQNQPFLPWLKNITNSSMRAFCSAPNGDFMAWFPDYFDNFDILAKMVVQPIELQDFTVDWSDQQIVTHEYVIGSVTDYLDATSGTVAGVSYTQDQIGQLLLTRGVATMDTPELFQMIYGKPVTREFLRQYVDRFGVRPNVESVPNVKYGEQEFFMALWRFQFYWASQFTATIPLTFMPEIWPGMIIQIPEYNFQAYVVEVEHSGSYGQGGSFNTNVSIIAPSLIDAKNHADMFGAFSGIIGVGGDKRGK